MRRKPALACVAAAFLAVACLTGLTSAAPPPTQLKQTIQPKGTPGLTTSAQSSPVSVLACPDVVVVALKATLISTQVGDPAVKTPRDTIRLEVTMENAGHEAVPGGKMLRTKMTQNSTAIYYAESTGAGKPPACRWISGYTESFQHGVPTTFTYEVLSISDTRQCTTAANKNKQSSLTMDESQLHAALKLKSPIHR